jgi:DNA repair and recombination RAD54-like protein
MLKAGRHDASPARRIGAVAAQSPSRNGDPRQVASPEKYPEEEEQTALKGKNKKDDNGDSEGKYKSVEEELGEDGNGIHDDSHAAVDGEDGDDTTEPEPEDKEDGEEEPQEAGEELRSTPSSNANADGNTRPGGDATPPVRKKKFEGLCLVDNADTTSAGEGLSKRLRSQRRCSDKKLLTRGTASKPYCIDVSDSEPEEEVVLDMEYNLVFLFFGSIKDSSYSLYFVFGSP